MGSKDKYALGFEFKTKTAEAILVDVNNGKTVASAINNYQYGLITKKLPGTDIELNPHWSLHHPNDYINALKRTVPKLLKESQVQPNQIIGIGIAFEGSIIIPTLKDGTPLALVDEFKNEPHAWPKHWKQQTAHDKAEQLTQIAVDRLEIFLDRYGGKIEPECFFSKVWEIFDESPNVYHAADRLIEATDWIVWQLTGIESRNISAAGFKALWSKSEGFPLETFFGAMHPNLSNIIQEKMMSEISPLGTQIGTLTESAASWMKLTPGIPIAAGMLSNYAAVPAATVIEPGKMVLILNDSLSQIVLSDKEFRIPGILGMVKDGVIPGFISFETGQSSGMNHLSWFLENALPGKYEKEARKQKIDKSQLIEEKAIALEPGQSGLIALDWLNGNQSILRDRNLQGIVVGLSLETKPEEIYRALVEATIFGTRKIFETFIASGMAIDEIIVVGGDPVKNRLFLSTLAQVANMEIKIAKSSHVPALGAATYAAVAAGENLGGYNTIQEAVRHMAHLREKTFIPNNADKQTYSRLYSEFTSLHDYFGFGHNNVMKRLKNQRETIFEKKLRLLNRN